MTEETIYTSFMLGRYEVDSEIKFCGKNARMRIKVDGELVIESDRSAEYAGDFWPTTRYSNTPRLRGAALENYQNKLLREITINEIMGYFLADRA